MESRIASGPLGGAIAAVNKKKGRWSGTGVEEVSGAEGGAGGDEVVEAGDAVTKKKGKGQGSVKEETEAKPEGGDKDGTWG